MAQLERPQRSIESPKTPRAQTSQRSIESPKTPRAQTSQRSIESPKTPRAQTSPTFEQLLRAEDAQWPSRTSPIYGMSHGQEEQTSPTHNKKSVLTKVKERAMKLRHTLSSKKRHGDEQDELNSPPAWGVTLDDDDDDNEQDVDPEFLGAPMYESELAPASYIENARQHPRAVPVLSEKHTLPTTGNHEAADQEKGKPFSPSKTISETVSGKFAPAYAAVSDATHTIASKIAGLTVTSPESQETSRNATKIHGGAQDTATDVACISVAPHANYDAKKLSDTSGSLSKFGNSPQKWDKGVSVKEYFLNKLEPGEDEKALSQAITEAISPRKSATSDAGVVEKVKGAVTSFFWHEEQPNSMAKAGRSISVGHSVSSDNPTYTQQNGILTNTHPSKVSKSASANYSRHIQSSTNSHEEYAEENLGRILQTN